MRLLSLILISVIIPYYGFAQALFEESIPNNSGVNKPVVTSSESMPAANLVEKKTVPSKVYRYLSTNLESVVIRGDIQLLYEMPQENQWSSVIMVHVNPHESLNSKSGSLGLLGGGRLYIDGISMKNPLFIQGLIGFNQRSSWHLMLALEFGQRIKWKKNIFMEISVLVNRVYDKDIKDPEWFFKAGLTFELNDRLLPFL